MYLFFYMELIFFGFEAGKSITRGIGIGGPWNGSFTPENLYVARHINNRYINSYTVYMYVVDRERQCTSGFIFCYSSPTCTPLLNLIPDQKVLNI
jgi:hypothetical protein